MTLQTSAGVTAQTARALIAPSFTIIWDELTKYPSEYGIGDKKDTDSDKKDIDDLGDPEKEKEKDEHYRPPQSPASELEPWSRAWNFTKGSIASTLPGK